MAGLQEQGTKMENQEEIVEAMRPLPAEPLATFGQVQP